MKIEGKLSLLYLVGALTSLLATVCMAVAWMYWQRTLNTCPDHNCGCLLNGKWTYSSFMGGTIHTCRFLTLCPIPIVIWSTAICAYHGYRACIPKKYKIVSTNDRRAPGRRVEVQRPTPMYALLTVVAIIFTILILSCGILLAHGYHVTCTEYKKSVVDQLKANGNLAELVIDRLSCQSAYDFMDYLQPDPVWLDIKQRRGSWQIQTALTLQFALAGVWINFFVYFALSIYNGVLYIKARKIKSVLKPPKPPIPSPRRKSVMDTKT